MKKLIGILKKELKKANKVDREIMKAYSEGKVKALEAGFYTGYAFGICSIINKIEKYDKSLRNRSGSSRGRRPMQVSKK